jgi:carboxyl-terminal processing protease
LFAEIEEKAKKYKPLVNYKSTLSFFLPNEMEAMSKDASLKKKKRQLA